MKVDKKDLEELYELMEELLSSVDDTHSNQYYYDLLDSFETIKAKIEGESC